MRAAFDVLLEQLLQFGREQLLDAVVAVETDGVRWFGGIGAAGHERGRLAGDELVQLRQHNDIELQTFRLMHRHHADAVATGIGDAFLADEFHEVAGPQCRRGLIAVCQFDELIQANSIA